LSAARASINTKTGIKTTIGSPSEMSVIVFAKSMALRFTNDGPIRDAVEVRADPSYVASSTGAGLSMGSGLRSSARGGSIGRDRSTTSTASTTAIDQKEEEGIYRISVGN
jgi:hypothetical protein